jgi:hypothetical protein
MDTSSRFRLKRNSYTRGQDGYKSNSFTAAALAREEVACLNRLQGAA